MQGEVLKLDPAAQLATVKHGKIEGWMDAMTMEYPVKDKNQFLKLRVGDKIEAKVAVQGTDYWIAAASPSSLSSVTTPVSSNGDGAKQ